MDINIFINLVVSIFFLVLFSFFIYVIICIKKDTKRMQEAKEKLNDKNISNGGVYKLIDKETHDVFMISPKKLLHGFTKDEHKKTILVDCYYTDVTTGIMENYKVTVDDLINFLTNIEKYDIIKCGYGIPKE